MRDLQITIANGDSEQTNPAHDQLCKTNPIFNQQYTI